MSQSSQSDGSQSEDSMWVRRLTFGQLKLKVEEEWGAGIGGTLWEGAVLMARWLSCEDTFDAHHWHGARCIELGAGATGIPGIVAAHLACFREVVITDIEECMERLRENVAASLPATAELVEEEAAAAAAASDVAGSSAPKTWDGRTLVRTCELDWRARGEQPPYEVVLVADVLYAEELVDPLLETLKALSTPESLVAIAIYVRSERTSARFWERLPQYFPRYAKVPEAAFGSPPQPDNIGIFLLSTAEHGEPLL